MNTVVPQTLGICKNESPHITVFMVCGADLVERFRGWRFPPQAPTVFLRRPGISLPTTLASGWEVAEGDMKPVSSTRIRDAINRGDWKSLVEEGCDPSVVEFMSAKHQAGNLFMGCGGVRSDHEAAPKYEK